MTTNKRFLLTVWAVTGLVVAIVAIQFAAEFSSGQVWTPLLILVFAVTMVFVTLSRAGDRKIRRLLQSDSPEPLTIFYRQTIRPGLIPNSDALLAHATALAYVLYADYDSARSVLNGADWDRCPPLIRASRGTIEALLCYFESREYVRGLDFAAAAQELAATPTYFPGARKAAAAYESYVEIGQVLCRQYTDATVTSLEAKMAVLPILGQILVAWGLAIAHRQRGESAPAEIKLAFIHDVAPFCRALDLPKE
jgi:hypothetical protein